MSRTFADLHGGNRSLASERYGVAPGQWVDFSANINPLGPPPAVLQLLRERLHEIERYPDPDAVAFRRALARYLEVPVEATRALNGGVEGIFLLLQAWRPQRVLIPVPTFVEYERAARAAGARVCRFPLVRDPRQRRYRLEPEAVQPLLGPDTVLVLANPNNPTGNVIDSHVLSALLTAVAEAGARLLMDEAFLDFLPSRRRRSLCAAAAGPDSPVAVVGSLTKLFALPGLRVGYLVGPPPLLARIDELRDPWAVNHLAQLAGEWALEQAASQTSQGGWSIAATRALIAQERARLQGAMAQLPGCTVWRSRANFLLLELNDSWPRAAELADWLGRRGILIRDASNFPGLRERHVRIAVRGSSDNDRLLAAMREAARHFRAGPNG